MNAIKGLRNKPQRDAENNTPATIYYTKARFPWRSLFPRMDGCSVSPLSLIHHPLILLSHGNSFRPQSPQQLHNNNNWQNTHTRGGFLEDLFPHSVYLPTSTKSSYGEIACLHAGTHPTPSSSTTGNILPMTAAGTEWVCRVRGHCKILIKIIDRNISTWSNFWIKLLQAICHMCTGNYPNPLPSIWGHIVQ